MSEQEKNQTIGIQETKELLIALNEVARVVLKHTKDGLQLGKDSVALVGELLMNAELKDAIAAAVNGLGNIPEEIKDLSPEEGLQLVQLQVDETIFILREFVGPKLPEGAEAEIEKPLDEVKLEEVKEPVVIDEAMLEEVAVKPEPK